MYEVWFENFYGNKRIIGSANDRKSAGKIVSDFLDEHNYKHYYTRGYMVNDMTEKLDVGSHCEFFYIIKKDDQENT